MTHSYGYKSKTRHLFAKKFRRHGVPAVATILTTYKVGQYVDVVADPSVRAGMPHKYYHGRTGIVWNVTPRGVGVIINKPHRNRILRKRICVRTEHVRPSNCRAAFAAKQRLFVEAQAAKTGKKLAPAKKGVNGLVAAQAAAKAGKKVAAAKPVLRSSRLGGTIRPAKVEKLARLWSDYDNYFDY